MKIFKWIDFAGQVLLIAGYFLYAIIGGFSEHVMIGYFVVGGWQVLSTIYHWLLAGEFTRHEMRSSYEYLLAWVIGVGIISVPAIMFTGLILWVCTPLMALWYCSICYSEIKLLSPKPSFQLENEANENTDL